MNFDDVFLTNMSVFSITLHEMYKEFCNAGFTEKQSMELINSFMVASVFMNGGGGTIEQ